MTNKSLPPAIFLMGPTASGKTDLAIALHDALPCEIISVDSALIYKDMDIGTAKPTSDELARAPHHLIDILDPAESYSVADFRRDALALMEKISAAGKIPLLVGGTMMYYKALVDGLSPLPQTDPAVREKVLAEADAIGWQAMHDRLAQIDTVAAARIHPNDPQRLSRALEVYELTGKTMTELQSQRSDPIPYNIMQFAIAPQERSVLHDRIAKRFELMLEAGFIDEVTKLKQRGDLHLDLPSMRCVGYRQVWQYLDNEFNYDELIAKGVAATRQLAKRQLTWLRSWESLIWLDTFSVDNLTKVVDAYTLANAR